MRTLHTESVIVIDVREEQAGDVIASGYGRAVPYGEEIDLGGIRESFEPGAFDADQAVGRPLAYRHGDPIGVIRAARNEPDGLYIEFDVVNTAQGRDAAVLMKSGASKGLSVGFEAVKSAWNQAGNAVRHVKANLIEVSQTHIPAYPTAGVAAVREEEMSESTITTTEVVEDRAAREAIDGLAQQVRIIEDRVSAGPQPHPLARYRSIGEYRKAILDGQVEARALFDQVTDDNPGVVPPSWMTEVRGIVDLGRRAITALGGPMNPGANGMTVNWPYFDGDLTEIVEAQANEKDEVNSVQISILKGDTDLATYAAGSDISYQLLQRSSPSYLDAHTRIMAASYAAVTDRAFTAALFNDGTGVENYDLEADTDGVAFRSAIFAASIAVEDATGQPASIVLASSALFEKIGGWSTFYPSVYGTSNVGGTAQASTLAVNVSGLTVIRAKWLDSAANQDAIVTNSLAARWLEDGPRLANAENVGQLGRDVAIYGFAAAALFIPAGVVRLYEV